MWCSHRIICQLVLHSLGFNAIPRWDRFWQSNMWQKIYKWGVNFLMRDNLNDNPCQRHLWWRTAFKRLLVAVELYSCFNTSGATFKTIYKIDGSVFLTGDVCEFTHCWPSHLHLHFVVFWSNSTIAHVSSLCCVSSFVFRCDTLWFGFATHIIFKAVSCWE